MSRTRNYATVVYPESAPENWLSIASMWLVPVFISPLHDKDINPCGEMKKAHYHVLIMFDNVKTLEQAETLFAQIGGVGCEVVNSIRGYARYLCHMDNPEKIQYELSDVLAFGGADYNAIVGLPSDKYKAVGEMIDFCRDNGITSYAYLLEWARDHDENWFKALCDNATVVIKEYLKSKTWENKTSPK